LTDFDSDEDLRDPNEDYEFFKNAQPPSKAVELEREVLDEEEDSVAQEQELISVDMTIAVNGKTLNGRYRGAIDMNVPYEMFMEQVDAVLMKRTKLDRRAFRNLRGKEVYWGIVSNYKLANKGLTASLVLMQDESDYLEGLQPAVDQIRDKYHNNQLIKVPVSLCLLVKIFTNENENINSDPMRNNNTGPSLDELYNNADGRVRSFQSLDINLVEYLHNSPKSSLDDL
jgi:hypothetical protein